MVMNLYLVKAARRQFAIWGLGTGEGEIDYLLSGKYLNFGGSMPHSMTFISYLSLQV